MKRVDRSELLELGEYEKVRDRFRARIILEKKVRRLPVGPHLMVLFENHDTVLLQIQEMLRTERITRESSVQHEIDTYNELLGADNELGATVMIEIPSPDERNAFLVKARGIERHLVLMVGDHAARAKWDEGRVLPDQASAVMYVKFALGEEGAAALRAGAKVTFVVDHPQVIASSALSPQLTKSLAEDVTA